MVDGRKTGEAASGLQVRPFQEADSGPVVQLWTDCGLVKPWNDPHRDIERKLTVQRELFLVGVFNGEVVAAIMAGYDGHRGWINYLAVHPAHQGQGYGAAMVRRVEVDLLAMGCPKINLQIRRTNLDVQRFYGELGYVEDACISMGKRLIPDD